MIRKLWHDEKPKLSGYYWLKTEEGNFELVSVRRGRVTSMPNGDMKLLSVNINDVSGKWSQPIPFPSLSRANKHEAGLKELTIVVIDCLAALDAVMSERESPARGQKVAQIGNALAWANDRAMHFALGVDFDDINALKRKRERLRRAALKAIEEKRNEQTA